MFVWECVRILVSFGGIGESDPGPLKMRVLHPVLSAEDLAQLPSVPFHKVHLVLAGYSGG